MSFVLSNHARSQMNLRGLTEDVINNILENPLEIKTLNDRQVYQGTYVALGKQYLVRIFVNHLTEPNIVITVYRTSKISKYYEGDL